LALSAKRSFGGIPRNRPTTPSWQWHCGQVCLAGQESGQEFVELCRQSKVLMSQSLNVYEAAAKLKIGKTSLYEALADDP